TTTGRFGAATAAWVTARTSNIASFTREECPAQARAIPSFRRILTQMVGNATFFGLVSSAARRGHHARWNPRGSRRPRGGDRSHRRTDDPSDPRRGPGLVLGARLRRAVPPVLLRRARAARDRRARDRGAARPPRTARRDRARRARRRGVAGCGAARD